MRYWYKRTVDEQRAELRQYTKKIKSQETQNQLPHVEPVPLIIDEDLSQNDRLEPIKV